MFSGRQLCFRLLFGCVAAALALVSSPGIFPSALAASADATLSNLAISSGVLTPGFASGTLSYSVSVGNAIASVTVTPIVNEPNATVMVDGVAVSSGNASGLIALSVGVVKSIPIVVTAQDTTTRTYTIAVTRAGLVSSDSTLSSLTISSGVLTPGFASGTLSYSVSVGNAIASVTVTPIVNEPNATVMVDGVAVSSGNASGLIALSVGVVKSIPIVVTAQDTTTRTYTIAVTRAGLVSSDSTLSSLTISSGVLTPGFASGTLSYSVSVGNAIASVTVTPIVNEPNATVMVDGVAVSSGNASGLIALSVGVVKSIPIVVTAQDTTTRTYTIAVTRAGLVSSDSTLSSLTISSGVLTPGFASGTLSYSVSVGNAIASVTVTPIVNEPNATVMVDGVAVSSGNASGLIALSVGVVKSIPIVVTAQDGTIRTYTITFTRATSPPPIGGGGGGFGGEGSVPPGPGVTNLIPYINGSGVFNIAVTAGSDDGKVKVIIAKDVTGSTADHQPLKSLSISPIADVPAPSQDMTIVGTVYDLSPLGATFTPAAELTISYDPAFVPKGVDEKNLVLANWDTAAGRWIDASATVDTVAHAIAGTIGVLSRYAVVANTRPASFSISGLTISPVQITAGGTISVSVKITNDGDVVGSYAVDLDVNGTPFATSSVTVAGGGTNDVTFSIIQNIPGKYDFDVNGLQGTFTVIAAATTPPLATLAAVFTTGELSITPSQVSVADNVTILVSIANSGKQAGVYLAKLEVNGNVITSKPVALAAGASQKVTFQVSEDVPGVYAVKVGDQIGSFEVKAPELPPASGINWWTMGGVVLAVVAVSTLLVQVIKHRDI